MPSCKFHPRAKIRTFATKREVRKDQGMKSALAGPCVYIEELDSVKESVPRHKRISCKHFSQSRIPQASILIKIIYIPQDEY